MSLSGPCFTQCLALMNYSLQLDCLGSCNSTSLTDHPEDRGGPLVPADGPHSILLRLHDPRTCNNGGRTSRLAEELTTLPHVVSVATYEEAREAFGYNHWYACDHIALNAAGYVSDGGA